MKVMPWWRWVLATFVIWASWIFLAAFTTYFADLWIARTEPWQLLFHDLITFLPFFLATPLVWRYVTGAPVSRLINVRGTIEYRRIVIGFSAWFIVSMMGSVADWALHPTAYVFTDPGMSFLLYAVIAVLLLPIQCWAEELFFRGWILRWAAPLTRLAQVVLGGVIFALPHAGNPEANGQLLPALTAWFLLGAGWSYVSVRDGGIEVAMGAHLANNIFALLFVGYSDAALPSYALVSTSALNMNATVVSLAIVVPLFAFITRRRQLS